MSLSAKYTRQPNESMRQPMHEYWTSMHTRNEALQTRRCWISTQSMCNVA